MKEIVVVLHNIRSLHNVGSIFRTADAAGVKKIYLCGITPAPVDVFGKPRPQLTKVSLGAERYVEWDASASSAQVASASSAQVASASSAQVASARSAQVASASSAQATLKLLENLKKQGFKIFAIEQNKKSIPYFKIKIKDTITRDSARKTAIILGNEIRGIPPSILKRADKILEIPMRGRIIRQAHHPRRTGQGKESLNVAVAFGVVTFHFLNS